MESIGVGLKIQKAIRGIPNREKRRVTMRRVLQNFGGR
jgi:hypothetical protein